MYQVYNKRTNAWVKMKMVKGRPRITNVKQSNPTKPFKGVPIKRKR